MEYVCVHVRACVRACTKHRVSLSTYRMYVHGLLLTFRLHCYAVCTYAGLYRFQRWSRAIQPIIDTQYSRKAQSASSVPKWKQDQLKAKEKKATEAAESAAAAAASAASGLGGEAAPPPPSQAAAAAAVPAWKQKMLDEQAARTRFDWNAATSCSIADSASIPWDKVVTVKACEGGLGSSGVRVPCHTMPSHAGPCCPRVSLSVCLSD